MIQRPVRRADDDCRIGRHVWYWTGWPDPVGWLQCAHCPVTKEIEDPV